MSPTNSDSAAPDRLLDPRAAAAHVGLSASTLAKWRSAAVGPPFRYLGGRIRYRLGELDSWADSRAARSTAERPAPARRRAS